MYPYLSHLKWRTLFHYLHSLKFSILGMSLKQANQSYQSQTLTPSMLLPTGHTLSLMELHPVITFKLQCADTGLPIPSHALPTTFLAQGMARPFAQFPHIKSSVIHDASWTSIPTFSGSPSTLSSSHTMNNKYCNVSSTQQPSVLLRYSWSLQS